MTSKSLFFKRMKQDLEQRIWLPVVFFLLGFLCMELPLISRLDSFQRQINIKPERIREFLVEEFFAPVSIFLLVTICMAVVGAMSGFSYMHSAKKLDVYHSIPIKRNSLFIQQYIYGVVYYLVPTVLHVLICLGICGGNNVLEGVVVTQALWYLLVQFLMFLAIYSTVILAVCLTGNPVITVLGSAVLLFYSLIIGLLRSALMQAFFTTYYDLDEFWNFPAFSPAHMLIKVFYNMVEEYGTYAIYSSQIWGYAEIFIMSLIYAGIALWLYTKRPTEVAGKTMAFSLSEPVVKTMVVLPLSITMGFFFSAFFSFSNEFGWFLFGCIFGFAIFCPLMEIIFSKDIKAVFRHPLQLVFNGVLVIGVVMVFKLDLVGYDSYLPAQSKVDSYAIIVNRQERIYVDGRYSDDFFMDMEIRDNESARMLVERGAEVTRPMRTGKVMEDVFCTSMTVKYNLKNGKEVYRNYLIDLKNKESMQWLGDVLEDPQFKKAFYPIMDESWEKNYVGVIVDYITDQDNIALSEEKMQRLIDTYREELMQLTFEEITTQHPVALMDLAMLDEDRKYGYWETVAVSVELLPDDAKYYKDLVYNGTEGTYRIYPSFTKTIALLEEYGARMITEIPLEDVLSITVEDTSLEEFDENGMWDKFVSVEYTKENGDESKMAEILPGLTDYRFYSEFQPDEPVMPSIDVSVIILRDEAEHHENFRVKLGMMPEFVTEDLKKAAQ